VKRAILFLMLAAAACDGSRTVTVRVSIPGADSADAPAAGVGVLALPYDRDSVVAALEASARTPRPNTAELDSLFAQFRGPFTAFARASLEVSALRDSLAAVRRSLDSLTPAGSGADGLQQRQQRQEAALARAEARQGNAQRALDAARARFAERGDSLRAAVRHWEDSTYRGYDSIVTNLAQRRGLQPVTDTTDAVGTATLRLRSGEWWIFATAWDANDPNAQWYWNVRVDQDTVRLSSANGRRRPRY
jgi:hypothetical protein